MVKLFNKLLVPVKFNANTRLAMEQSVQLANRFDSDVHVLYVQTPLTVLPFLYQRFLSPSAGRCTNEETESKLAMLKKEYSPILRDGLVMTTSFLTGNWQTILKETIIREHADLVIIPRQDGRLRGTLLQQLNINRISQQTHCPVLTVTSTFNINLLQKIVVPVNDCLPVNKLTMATYLARESNSCIHLVGSNGYNSSQVKKRKKYLLRAYQLLREYSQVTIHCSLDSPVGYPVNMLRYAKKVSADLIVLNTGAESGQNGWLNRLLGKHLYEKSNIPVLTIAP